MPADTLHPAPQREHCNYCPVHALCLVRGADDRCLDAWRAIAQPTITLRRAGQCLTDVGEPLRQIYIVRSGCIKASVFDAEGNEHVRGFALPGDLVGLDAMAAGRHTAALLAVTPAQLCAVPADALLQLIERQPLLMRRLIQSLSGQLDAACALAADNSAEARIAGFLMQMQQRLPSAQSGAMQLPMPRRDIASHLRLATETVSRVITRFQRRGWIMQKQQRLYLLQRDTLAQLAGLDAPHQLLAQAA